ncbi:MAG: efflux RND transporter periplasmic adaptor subunit [Bacteroides sp.]|nr:efflux RND transporter periplasmic adaptor subunit [Roseburia sp.]MCM1347098.1 efflux RND transporter periplasmic adaptor subunit [Bacteroides sp.]MCM1420721.1 efflux RND transporter periplasmic adaptor subunit [Bacteroides sp.]
MKKNCLGLIAATTILSLFSCGGKNEKALETVFVNTAEAVSTDKVGKMSWPGRTKASEDINVAFRVSGPIVAMRVKEGDHVRKGQVIAEIDDRDYKVQLGATQAEYEHIKADAERVMAMYKEGNTTASNYDKARYGLQQITEKLNNHRNQLADTKLKSPIDGYVQTLIHQSGETVGAGMPVVSMFTSGNTEVEIFIPASDFSRLETLGGFKCSFDIIPEQTFPLEIVRTSKDANASQLYAVRLRIKGELDKKKITPGMTTMVYASNEGNGSRTVSVPSTAVFHKNGKTAVFVLDQTSGTLKEKAVTVGMLKTDGTTVIISGLAEGETVVATGTRHLTEGQKVSPLPKTTQSNVGGMK